MLSEGFLAMNEGVGREREIFALSLLLGLILGGVYAFIRAARRGLELGRIAEGILEFVYTLLFGSCWFLLSVSQTGEARGFVLAGMLLGGLAERYTAGRAILFVFSRIFGLIRKGYRATAGRLTDKIDQKIRAGFVEIITKFKKVKKKEKRA